jgi:GAF domain-containing protein
VRFRYQQLHRADRAAAECEEALEAVGLHLDFALAGFADRALLDLSDGRQRLVRLVTTTGEPGPCEVSAGEADGGIPVGYPASHPAVQALERTGTVRTTIGSGRAGAYAAAVQVDAWAAARRWPPGMAHGLVTVLRSRGRTVGALTFLRGAGRRDFDRADAAYAEDVAARVAMALDLAGLPRGR